MSWLRLAIVFIGVLITAGCDDLHEFRTQSGRSFRGTIVGGTDESFIRRGFPSGIELLLAFDPDRAVAGDASPGDLRTTDGDGVSKPTFDSTPLEVIAPLAHDQLSEYDFPGGGRVQNFIFFARPKEGPLASRDASVFISLMDNRRVEVRIIARSGDDPPVDYFGVFPLTLKTDP